MTFEFREWVDGSQPGAIDPQHQGPCAVYMKKVESAIADNNAAGDGWFKIWDEGFDEAAGKWCINKMIENNGHLSVKMPFDIEAGYYLVRPELLALHAAQESPPDPQFYVGCAQIYLESTGSANPATISIPENYVDISMPGLTFNIYSKPLALPYPMFGPSAYNGGGSPAPSATATATRPSVSSSSVVSSPSTSDYVEAPESTTPAAPATSDAVETDSTETDDADTYGSDVDTPANNAEVDNTQADDTEDDDAEVDDTQTENTEEDDLEEAEADEDDAEADDADVGDSEDDGAEEDDAEGNNTSDDECDAEESEDDSESDENQTSSSYSRRDVQIEGLKPEGCIMVNANWCGFEVKSYSDENGCWSASADCWTQSKACFDQAPPTGAQNCELWNDKCNNLDDTCNAKQFTGPPNAGKDLTPTPPDLASTASRKLMALVRKHESHVMRRAYRARH